MTDEHSAGWQARLVESYGLPADTVVEPRRPGRHVIRPVRAGGRRFLLKAVPMAAGTVTRLHWQLGYQRHLASHGGPAACPFERSDIPGEMQVAHPCEGLGALYEHLPGRPCQATPHDAEAAGRALATLHRLSDGYGDAGGAPLGEREHLVDGPVRTVRDYLGGRMPDGIGELAGRLGDWLDRLPREPGAFGLCHGDSHHENAFIDGEGRVRYFDFEHAARTWRAYDLATFIWNTFRLDRGTPVWNGFMGGYAGIRPPSVTEAAWIRPFLVVRQLWWLGFTVEATPRESGSLRRLVDDGLAFALRLADDLDVHAVLAGAEDTA